jgi:SAM-dependent methyltransferase
MREIRTFFNEMYSGGPYWTFTQSINPEELAGSIMAQHILRWAIPRPPGRAIDFGSGEGADAIRLAMLGWEVHAVEISEVGAARIEQRAKELGLQIQVYCEDASVFTTSLQFDLVVSNGLLHYLENKASMCRLMQAVTSPGGANAITVWSDYSPVPSCHQVVPTFPDSERGVVVGAYAAWRKTLLYFERNRAENSHAGMPAHVHSYIKMFAERPSDQ